MVLLSQGIKEEREMKKYLSLEIFKNNGEDFSNGGLSSKTNTCYIECKEGWIDESRVPTDQIVKLELGAFGSIHLVPIKEVPSGNVGYMFGGCYVATSDGRLDKMVEELLGHRLYGAIALHDRTETQEEYHWLSI